MSSTHWFGLDFGEVMLEDNIEISVFNTKSNEHLESCKSIVDDVYVGRTPCGYEVIINLKTRNYIIHSNGSGTGPSGEYQSIILETEDEVWHTVRWNVPNEHLHLGHRGNMTRFTERCKDQIIVYYVDNDILVSKGKAIYKWECPSQGLRRSLRKLKV